MKVIQVTNLYKDFGKNKVLKNITFTIEQGQCVAIIGPNGAGKTTLMSCLNGDLFATAGDIKMNENNIIDSISKTSIGVLPQENVVPSQLKVKELINFFQSIYKDSLNDQEIQELLQFDQKQYNLLAEKLSGGQKRLLTFIFTLIGKPKILFLDEPTAAMDTSTRQRFWKIIDCLKSKQVTIVYSSHYIEEVEHTADRILVLYQGELLRDTTPHQMRMEDMEKQFIVPKKYCEEIKKLSNIFDIKMEYDSVRFKTKTPNEVLFKLEQIGVEIQDIEMMNKSLLNTIFEKTGGN